MNRRRLAIVGALATVAGALLFFFNTTVLPFAGTPYSPVLYANNGSLLSVRIAADGQWRFPCGGQLPERYRVAVLEQEDRRFFYHPGVDPIALIRAFFSNLKAGRVVSGGSTLTMQLARLEEGRPRTLWSKLWEAFRAFRLEAGHDKEALFSFYACQVPMGGNIVGLEAAAWGYFGRAPKDLSWAESALLAVLPNDPALIYPGRNHERLKRKRDNLLEKLFHRGLLPELDRDLAVSEPVPDRMRGFPKKTRHLLDTLAAGHTKGPFESTIDDRIQETAQRIFDEHAVELKSRGIYNAALLVLENRDGRVLAYIGNVGWSTAEGDGRDVDIVRSPRSTGSLLKPFLYAAMLEEGTLTTNMLVPDVPTVYKGYKPENFDRTYKGAVSASQALATSLNVPAVRLLKQYGVGRFRDLLAGAGMTTLTRSNDDYGLSLILGGAEGTLFELTGLYAGMARRLREGPGSGFHFRPVVLTGEEGPETRFPPGPGAVWLVFESLVEANRPEGENFWKSFEHRRRIAWKTGTSIGMRDAWAIGTTPELTIGVWAGNADGRGVSGLTGLTAAAPLMFDLFRALPLSEGWFTRPDGDLRTVSLCSESGYPATAACPAVVAQVPLLAAGVAPCPYHRVVHLGREGKRVHSGCADVASMRHESRFILPAVMEYYYRSYHPEYRSAPPWREGCEEIRETDRPIGILYPPVDTAIYIPIQLDGSRGKAIFKMVHRDPSEKVFWHIDDHFMGSTTLFHELEVDVAPGEHLLTVVDEEGNRAERRFRVLPQNR